MIYERIKGILDSKYFDVVLISVCYFWFLFIFWLYEILLVYIWFIMNYMNRM